MKKILTVVFTVLVIGMMLSMAPCGSEATSNNGGSGEGDSNSGGVVKIICPYGVGGTADVIARKYALVAGKLYPEYNFIVENMTGGDGFAAAAYFTDLDVSTTDLLVYGYGVAYRHDVGTTYGTEVVDFDRSEIYPVASIDDRTWILYANPDTTLADILAKAKTDGIKMSGGNPLSDPHLALGSLIAQEGGSVMVVPYDGGANQKKGLTDGEVDVFVGTTQAGQDETEAGAIVPILAFSENEFAGFITPDGPITVPSISGSAMAPELTASIDHTGSILPAGGFIATRTGASQEWIDTLAEISEAVWADPEFHEWIEDILLNRFEVYGEEANRYLNEACEKAIKAFETLS